MEAGRRNLIVLLSGALFGLAGTVCAEPSVLQSLQQAPLLEPTPAEVETGPLALPELVAPTREDAKRGAAPLREAFDLRTIRPPRKTAPTPAKVRLATAERPRPQSDAALEFLIATERLANNAVSIGDFTDVIERCDQWVVGESSLDPSSEESEESEAKLAVRQLASWAYNRRGELRGRDGDERAAFDDFRKAVQLDGQSWRPLHNRALLYAAHGHHDRALRDFTHVLRLEDDLPIVYANRAESYFALGKWTPAIADFTVALDRGGLPAEQLAHLHAGRAAAYRQLGQNDHAARDLNRAIELAPRSAHWRTDRGALYASLGYYEQATVDFAAALKLDPQCETAYRRVAWMLATCPDAKFRDADKAVEAARRALAMGDTEDPLLLDTAAAAYASAGDMATAIRYQQQAVLLADETLRPQLRERLGRYRRGEAYRAAER